MISDLISIAKMLMEVIRSSGTEIRRAVLHGVVYVVFSTGLYASWSILRADGNVIQGLSQAFLFSESSRREADRAEKSSAMQYELRSVIATDALIERSMSNFLEKSGGARSRLAVIHNGISGITGIGLLKFDVINVVAAPGRSTGSMVINQPLAQWNGFFSRLLHGDCALVGLADITSDDMRGRMSTTASKFFLGCPVVDVIGQTLGGVFILWDQGDVIPTGTQMDELMEEGKLAGRQIGAALELRLSKK
jgi:hypothetical protein